MATASRSGGLYYTDRGLAVDAEGKEVKDAPKQPKNTAPETQPGALGAPTPEERMATAIASALRSAGPGSPRAAEEGDESEGELPTLAELPDHLAGLDTVSEIEALQAQDDRRGSIPMYESRLAELKGA